MLLFQLHDGGELGRQKKCDGASTLRSAIRQLFCKGKCLSSQSLYNKSNMSFFKTKMQPKQL